jgi:hypothetical protein
LFNLRSKTTKTKVTESAGGTTKDEIESWIVQCVLDMDVNPLEEALHSAKKSKGSKTMVTSADVMTGAARKAKSVAKKIITF